MRTRLKRWGKLILFGNGGSAADAQHLVAELTERYLQERRALAAVALKTPRIQEAHILLGHALCEIIEGTFADEWNIS